MALYEETGWHEGEEKMQDYMGLGHRDNPTVPALSPQLAAHLQIAPLIAIGTLDSDGRPWTTLWGGERGMSQPMGNGIIGIRTAVTGQHDPVIETLVGTEPNGVVVREEGRGRMVSGLTLDLETRKRVKLFGRMLAGALSSRDDEVADTEQHTAEIQLVLRIEQSLGNCPKYLNRKQISPAPCKPMLISDSPILCPRALSLIAQADLFFISSAQHNRDMDTNHRGGPTGFLRVASNTSPGAVLCWPEYSGNRLYQTLGNLMINPLAGVTIPDFISGDMLYLTGTTEIFTGKEAAAVLPHSNLCVRLRVSAARFVAQALPFRGIPSDPSPYNPNVRVLATEKPPTNTTAPEILQQARLVSRMDLTPTISRFRFSLENTTAYKPGQYVTLDFSSHLDIGYSHMRDDDPRSLNDDFIRTFTVSSTPGSPQDLQPDEFEITIRQVGVATKFLFQHHPQASSRRGPLEIGVKGFGGEFKVIQQHSSEEICFIAAGIGITPLLPALGTLDLSRLRFMWSVRAADVGLVVDTLCRYVGLAKSTSLFVSDATPEVQETLRRTDAAAVHARRVNEADLRHNGGIERYYLCVGTAMRRQIMAWMGNKQLVYEDFDF